MSDDLVKRLRDVAEATGPNEARQIALDAADRIEQLEAKLAKMQRSRDRYREAWETEKSRTTLAELKEQADESST